MKKIFILTTGLIPSLFLTGCFETFSSCINAAIIIQSTAPIIGAAADYAVTKYYEEEPTTQSIYTECSECTIISSSCTEDEWIPVD